MARRFAAGPWGLLTAASAAPRERRPRRTVLEEKLFMTLSYVCPPASSGRDEAETLRTILARRHDVAFDRFTDQRRHRLTLPPRNRLKLALEALIDKDGRALHMMYDIIYRFVGGPELFRAEHRPATHDSGVCRSGRTLRHALPMAVGWWPVRAIVRTLRARPE